MIPHYKYIQPIDTIKDYIIVYQCLVCNKRMITTTSCDQDSYIEINYCLHCLAIDERCLSCEGLLFHDRPHYCTKR